MFDSVEGIKRLLEFEREIRKFLDWEIGRDSLIAWLLSSVSAYIIHAHGDIHVQYVRLHVLHQDLTCRLKSIIENVVDKSIILDICR